MVLVTWNRKVTCNRLPLCYSDTGCVDSQGGIIVAAKKKMKTVPKGYHRMPDGSVMKDSAHKKATKRTSASVRRNNMDM